MEFETHFFYSLFAFLKSGLRMIKLVFYVLHKFFYELVNSFNFDFLVLKTALKEF